MFTELRRYQGEVCWESTNVIAKEFELVLPLIDDVGRSQCGNEAVSGDRECSAAGNHTCWHCELDRTTGAVRERPTFAIVMVPVSSERGDHI